MSSIQKKTVKGIDYWYLIESKRVNGKVKTEVLEYFGNTKKLMQRFAGLLNQPDELVLKSYSHGDTHALLKIAQKLNIEQILADALPSQTRDGVNRSTSLLLIALQRVCKPASKMAFSKWYASTTLPDVLGISPELLTSNHFWEQMDGISEEQLQKAEDKIAQHIFELYDFKLDKIALDYTNYFSYIDSANTRCEVAKRGRNKQKRNDLRQYSMAVVTLKDMGIPLYSHIYEGNRNDQTEFKEYIQLLKKRIPNYNEKELTIVFDGGSVNKKNLASIENHYICRFPLSSCKALYDVNTEEYDIAELNGKEIAYKKISKEIWGNDRTCVLTFSPALREGECKALEQDIRKTEELLENLNERLSNERSRLVRTKSNIEERLQGILSRTYMKEIFKIELVGIRKIKGISYEIEENRKAEIIKKYFGKKLIITNREDWSAKEIIKTYHDQDCIEKVFKDSKNSTHFSIRPQYHYTDQKIRVHIFCCLLGLVLVGILNKELRDRDIKMSNLDLIERLGEIRQCRVKEKESNKVTKALEEMEEANKVLWEKIQEI